MKHRADVMGRSKRTAVAKQRDDAIGVRQIREVISRITMGLDRKNRTPDPKAADPLVMAVLQCCQECLRIREAEVG